tara:strand:+ start:156 stop:476 length:321 start_codon:yes stop_codon:yes gene_type:complete
MKITITNKDLKNFLDEQGLTKEFKKEIRSQRDYDGTLEVESIVQAINWGRSKRGFQYWKSVNGAFEDAFEAYELGTTPTITLSVEEYNSLLRDRDTLEAIKQTLQD